MASFKNFFDTDDSQTTEPPIEVAKGPFQLPSLANLQNIQEFGYLGQWNQGKHHLYIGPQVDDVAASRWDNPFRNGQYELVRGLREYENHITNSPQMMSRLDELEGKILGCFCHPRLCHGDVLIKIYDKFRREPSKVTDQERMDAREVDNSPRYCEFCNRYLMDIERTSSFNDQCVHCVRDEFKLNEF